MFTDRSKGLYVDTLNNKKYKIQEAIQKGLVIAEAVSTSKADASNEVRTNQETTVTVTAVLHPNSGEKLSITAVSCLPHEHCIATGIHLLSVGYLRESPTFPSKPVRSDNVFRVLYV